MRLQMAAFLCAAMVASPLAAEELDRWQFTAADDSDFIAVAHADVIDEGGEILIFEVGRVTFGEDYGTLSVPEAPNSQPGDAPTTGLVMAVNLGEIGPARVDSAGVWTNSSYSGNYRVEVDVFFLCIGSSGTTENVIIGINHTQTEKTINFNQNNADIPSTTDPNPGVRSGLDGYWLNYFGDIDLAFEDVVFHYGVPDSVDGEGGFVAGQSPHSRAPRNPGQPEGIDRGVFGGGLTWGDGLFPDKNFRDAQQVIAADLEEDPDAEDVPVTLFTDLFPYAFNAPRPELPGALTNVWTTFRFDYVDGVLSIYARQFPNADQEGEPTDFQLLLTYDDPEDRWTEGRVYLGMEDVFSGINELNRMVYDNLVITALDDVTPPGLGDINNDGVVNVADVTELANLIAGGNPPANEVGDINNDGSVDSDDVQALADLIAND